MMADALELLHREYLPKMTDVIVDGIAHRQSHNGGIERTVESYLKGAFRREGDYDGEGLPDNFNFLNLKRVTPLEEHKLRTDRIKPVFSRRAGLDISKTSTYVVKAVFTNNGDTFERPIAIPFVERGNLIYIRNSLFGISNVMKSRGMSRTPNGYFVEFPRHKVTFESTVGEFEMNGRTEHVLIPTATNLHSKTGKRTFKPVIVGWLLAKYGVTETFRRFGKTDVQVYANNDPALAEIDHGKFYVCRGICKGRAQCPIVLVVPRASATPELKVLVGGTLYIAASEPDQMSMGEADALERWMILLGYMIYGKNHIKSLVHILEEMQTHLTSIERFMDEKFKRELFSVNIEADDIYEFLFHIIYSMTKRSTSETRDIANLEGRFISPVEYMLRDLRESIFETMYSITRQARKDRGSPIPTNQIKQMIDRGIPIDRVTKMNTGHGEIASFNTASDNLLLAQTANCIDQTEAKKQSGRGGGTISMSAPDKQLHASYVFLCSILWQPKSSPYSTSRINPYVCIDEETRISVRPEDRADYQLLQADLDQKGF